MDRAQMIEMAQAMRSRDRFGLMTPEEIAVIPGSQRELWVQIEGGKTVHIFEIRPHELRPSAAPMILNFHGGGFVKGRTDRDHRYCAEMATKLGCLVWDVDYCLAPENPFPAAVEESYAVVAYAFAHAEQLGVDPQKIALAGHSAGGNLVAVIILKALEAQAFRPCCALMEYFPANHTVDPITRYTREQLQDERNVKRGKTEQLYGKFYCDPESEAAKSIFASPVLAQPHQLAGFPHSLVISAEQDSLREETEQFARNLQQAGVQVEVHRIPGAMHGFTVNRTEGWKKALAIHEAFFQNHFKEETL